VGDQDDTGGRRLGKVRVADDRLAGGASGRCALPMIGSPSLPSIDHWLLDIPNTVP